jgi:SAM-dependent methyltransferase
MDNQSMEMMKKFASKISDGNVFSSAMSVLDVGSLDVNGSYRELFPEPKFAYTGIDIVPGKNVDFVMKDPHKYTELADSSWDVVVSGQALEHVEDIYAVADEMIRVLKSNGLMCVIVPCMWEEHKFPIDCWRFYPDGLRWLFVKRHPLLMEEVAIGTQGNLCIAVLRRI